MNKETFVQQLMRRLGDRSDEYTAENIRYEADMAQSTTLEQDATLSPWFLESAWTEMMGTDDILLPLDFLEELEDSELQINIEGNWVPLIKGDYDELVAMYGDTPSVPLAYALNSETITLLPPALEVSTLRFKYKKKDVLFSVVDDLQENMWLKHAPDLLMAEVGRVISAMYLRDEGLAALFQSLLTEAKNRLYIQNENREHVNRSYKMDT
jgi:hypothetical protein